MLHTLFSVITYLLAIYGALILCIEVFGSIWRRMRIIGPRFKLVLLVKDQEETVEGIVRSVYISDFFSDMMRDEKLTVIDMGSTDNTYNILLKLRKDYEYMDVLKYDEKDSAFSSFGENNEKLSNCK